MDNKEKYQYLIDLANLAQYFIFEGLTLEVDHRLCSYL